MDASPAQRIAQLTGQARADARAIFDAAVAAVEPRAAVRAHLMRAGDALVVDGARIALAGRVVALGMGKASAAMAQEVEAILGDRLAGGVVVTKYGHGAPLARLRLLEAGHPLPDDAGVAASAELERAVAGLSDRDLVVVCLSGGASALMPAPRPPLTLADKQAVSRLLLGCGADIAAMNTVRKKLSRLKGGGLARACQPASVLTLAISDVLGDDWSVIGSGPTSPDPSTFADARAVVERFGIADRLPPAAAQLLARGCAGEIPDTPKDGDACFARATRCMLASNRQALDAAEAAARACGYRVERLAEPLRGEAQAAAAAFAERLLALGRAGGRSCLIAGGETTVTLGERHGRGGRNQEFALTCALAMAKADLERAGCSDGSPCSRAAPTAMTGPPMPRAAWSTAGRSRARSARSMTMPRPRGPSRATTPIRCSPRRAISS